MTEITIKDEFIKLGQLLKMAGLTSSGLDSKIVITNGEVKVNGEVRLERGKKIYHGDIVEFNNQKIKVKSKLKEE